MQNAIITCNMQPLAPSTLGDDGPSSSGDSDAYVNGKLTQTIRFKALDTWTLNARM
jgi:hypothetical protein